MGCLILDLCGGTGAWSKPYAEAGYNVRMVTLPEDVRLFKHPGKVHGILIAPPCTVFAVSGNRWKRTEQQYQEALSVVDACLRCVAMCSPTWWVLENPVGILHQWIGKPKMYFHPCDYGDPYTKKTCLWGNFTVPIKRQVEPTMGSEMLNHGWDIARQTIRSVTPAGFARAFFEANP